MNARSCAPAAVSNVFTADPDVSQEPWYHPEHLSLTLLYRMADFYQPTWIVMLDDDEFLSDDGRTREILSSYSTNVAALTIPKICLWRDAEFPDLPKVMQRRQRYDIRIWRHREGLQPGTKRLHNGYAPSNVRDGGVVATEERITLYNDGWDTLAKRIERVRLYTALDPDCTLNNGVPYDKGLLFGYSIDAIPALIEEYRKRSVQNAATAMGGVE